MFGGLLHLITDLCRVVGERVCSIYLFLLYSQRVVRVSLWRLIKQFPDKLSDFPNRERYHDGKSLSSYTDKFWFSPRLMSCQGESLGSYQDTLSGFPSECFLIWETHQANTYTSLLLPLYTHVDRQVVQLLPWVVSHQEAHQQLFRQVLWASLGGCEARSH